MAEKQLVVAVEATAAMAPFWLTIFHDYLQKIIRSFCRTEVTGQKLSAPNVQLSLVTFNAHGANSAFLVARSGWTRDMDTFLQWLSAISFAGGRFNDAAIAEGLADALMMLNGSQGQQNVDNLKHCILVAASNPYTLPTPVYQPHLKNVEKNGSVEEQLESQLFDAEAIAKYFAQLSVSLSVICPKQLPKLRAIYNSGKRNTGAADPPIDNVKNPYYLVLISENFLEARAGLSLPGTNANLAMTPMVPGPTFQHFPPVSGGSGTLAGIALNQNMMSAMGSSGTMMPTPGMNQQGPGMLNNNTWTNIPLSQQISSVLQSAQSKYVKVWEGNLFGMRQGQPAFITRLEGYRRASDSDTLAANWPSTIKILKLIPQDHMNNKQYVEMASSLVFRAMTQHGFLGQLHERKLCAVIQLPSQTLLLSVSDRVFRLIGMLLPDDVLEFTSKISSQQQQTQQQQLKEQVQQQQQHKMSQADLN